MEQHAYSNSQPYYTAGPGNMMHGNQQMYGGGDSAQIYANQMSDGDYNPDVHSPAAQSAGFKVGEESGRTHTLYVGNLDPRVKEDYVTRWFNQAGQVTKVKVNIDENNLAYAFVEFSDAKIPAATIQVLGKQELLGREVKLACVVQCDKYNHYPSEDTSDHFTIYVANLPRELNHYTGLIAAFSEFGNITSAKIIYDHTTGDSKRYGFVSFSKRQDAEDAIEKANGAKIGDQKIFVNWATHNARSS